MGMMDALANMAKMQEGGRQKGVDQVTGFLKAMRMRNLGKKFFEQGVSFRPQDLQRFAKENNLNMDELREFATVMAQYKNMAAPAQKFASSAAGVYDITTGDIVPGTRPTVAPPAPWKTGPNDTALNTITGEMRQAPGSPYKTGDTKKQYESDDNGQWYQLDAVWNGNDWIADPGSRRPLWQPKDDNAKATQIFDDVTRLWGMNEWSSYDETTAQDAVKTATLAEFLHFDQGVPYNKAVKQAYESVSGQKIEQEEIDAAISEKGGFDLPVVGAVGTGRNKTITSLKNLKKLGHDPAKVMTNLLDKEWAPDQAIEMMRAAGFDTTTLFERAINAEDIYTSKEAIIKAIRRGHITREQGAAALKKMYPGEFN